MTDPQKVGQEMRSSAHPVRNRRPEGGGACPPRLFLITGERGAGKTTFCRVFIDRLRERSAANLDVAGIVSAGVWEGNRKVGIDAVAVRSGERRCLAIIRRGGSAGPGTQSWVFQPETVAWANRLLAQAVPCDVLVVDELGPLEWLQGQGFMAGIEAVSSGHYRHALAVVRAGLLDHAMPHWPQAKVIWVDSISQARALARHWAQQLEVL